MMMIESIHSLLIILITIPHHHQNHLCHRTQCQLHFCLHRCPLSHHPPSDLPPTCTHTCLLFKDGLLKPQAELVLDNRGGIGAWALIQFPDLGEEDDPSDWD